MVLHEDKFELLVHRGNPNESLYELPFVCQTQTYKVSGGNMLYPTDQVKDLGVIVFSDMSWSHQVSSMASRARKVAAWVLSAFKCRNRITMLTLYKSLVRSHLEYCCPLWNTSKISDIQQIEGAQRTFTSKIWGVQHLDYWQRRRERYIIIHMWKILHQRCSNDHGINFSTPSRHGIKATIPSLSKSST